MVNAACRMISCLQVQLYGYGSHSPLILGLTTNRTRSVGCPASAAVERLFSKVGVAYAAKRKREEASTPEDIMFTSVNLP